MKENKFSTRREFFQEVSAIGAGVAIITTSSGNASSITKLVADPSKTVVNMFVNGKSRTIEVDPRMSLLDALREELNFKGTKKGCDRGQCGACTVIADGKRINSCLSLVAMCGGKHITTIEGLGSADQLHPMQEAFLKHDAFQCGYCTPGQICSAVALLQEGHAKTIPEIKEAMSGNICRCGAYQNIVNAIKELI